MWCPVHVLHCVAQKSKYTGVACRGTWSLQQKASWEAGSTTKCAPNAREATCILYRYDNTVECSKFISLCKLRCLLAKVCERFCRNSQSDILCIACCHCHMPATSTPASTLSAASHGANEAETSCSISGPGISVWCGPAHCQHHVQALVEAASIAVPPPCDVPEPNRSTKLAHKEGTEAVSKAAWNYRLHGGEGITVRIAHWLQCSFAILSTVNWITSVSRPYNLGTQQVVWSNYKQTTTLKYLICVNNKGAVSFISKAYGGRISDKAITLKSGEFPFVVYIMLCISLLPSLLLAVHQI